MNTKKINRRDFINQTGVASSLSLVAPFYIGGFRTNTEKEILGHGDYRYRLDKDWGKLDSAKYPVNNCHEMVMDRRGRMILLTDHPKNNILIYDKSGKLLENWTLNFAGAHGLTIHDEGAEQFLYITDTIIGSVVKTDLSGRIILSLEHPAKSGIYSLYNPYKPTETAIGPNGDIYVADGYGSQFILQFSADGKFIRKFGGDSFLQQDKFKQVHGVTLDTRDKTNPTLLCAERVKNTIKRFSLNGEFIEDIYLPGAFISRAVVNDNNIYLGVCFGMSKNNYNMQLNRGFVTILDQHNRVVSNPGGEKPIYRQGKLQLMFQDQPVFKHCHDVCVDEDKNLYVCQWNADHVYPFRLVRV